MRLHTAFGAAAIGLFLSGCSGPWAEHYEGTRLNPLEPEAAVKLEAASAAEVKKGETSGFVLLGTSRFEQPADAGEGPLEEFARSIGSSLVLFSIEDAGERTRKVRKAEYVPSNSLSGGSYVDADGVVRTIDMTSNNYMYVEVEREITERVWKHAAAFFAPADSTQK